MNKLRKTCVAFRMIILVPMLILLLLPMEGSVSAATAANTTAVCGATTCAKQKAILRRLEKTRPGKKLTRQQIFNQIKAACDKMRQLDCPDIRNYKPTICFTDF